MNTSTFRLSVTVAVLLIAAPHSCRAQIPTADLERMEQAAPARATVRTRKATQAAGLHTLAGIQAYGDRTGDRQHCRSSRRRPVHSSRRSAQTPPSSCPHRSNSSMASSSTIPHGCHSPIPSCGRASWTSRGTAAASWVSMRQWTTSTPGPKRQEMFGGCFDGHPWTGDGTWAVTIEDPGHPLMKSFHGKDFTDP